MSLWRRFKLWMAGYSTWSRCWLGQHRWDMPGGHCEKCGKCDEFFGPHRHDDTNFKD
jgi:hypothetical protein